ncbi:MAG TPA: acyloxyacyl hydrolase [Gemmatimonadales bacterium]|nr:acyloxyacyl hydrolase [Gemmatimonadales bacterium]
MTRSTAVVVVALIAIPGSARAQGWEIGARLGGGPSIVTAKYGGVPEGGLLVASVYTTRPVMRWKGFAAGYFAELAPLVVMTKVPAASGSWFRNRDRTDSVYIVAEWDSGAVAGVGFQPVGLRFSQQVGSGLRAYAEASGGCVAFARAVPDPDARSLNFLASAGVGIRIGKFGHRSYALGYRFTHISNAYTAHSNPGYNAHILYLGLTIR